MQKQELSALLYVKNSEKFGLLQTIGVSVNYAMNQFDKQAVKEDLLCIATLVGKRLKQTSVTNSSMPFPHGFVDLFFENNVLVRYAFTATNADAYKDWRLYLTDVEAYLREGREVLEILVAKPESKPTEHLVKDFAKETKNAELFTADEEVINDIVNQIL